MMQNPLVPQNPHALPDKNLKYKGLLKLGKKHHNIKKSVTFKNNVNTN